MGRINVNGKVINFTSADATNNIIKAENGKYYQKGPKGYREIKQNGQSIFDAAAKKSAEAKKKAQAAANYNKKEGFEPNKKYYVVGNSSYFTMVDKNYNTLYYKDNQRITKEQFQKGANCVYDAKSKIYIARDAKNVSHKYATKFRQTVKDSKTGRYFVEVKGGQRKYFEANGKEISERAFLDIEKAYIDSDGKIAKYDWKAKAKNAAKGIGNMFADMVTEEVPVYKKDKNGRILLDRHGKPIVEKNKDGSPKTDRKFSLSRTCTTVLVGGAIATVCVLAAPVAAAGAAFLGVGAGTAATIGTIAGVGTQLGIAGYFGYEGGKQMYNANEENKNVLLSNNERMENWKKKGAGGAQVGMSLMMVKGSVKNAPKTRATARNTAKAIETKNNATLMAKGKVGLRDRISNTRSGFSETVGWKALKKGVGDYHKNNSLKTKVADVAKAPLKLAKETVMEPVRLVRGTLRGGARLITKKGRAKIKGNIKEWKNSFKDNPQGTPALTPEQAKAQQEANAKFKQNLADMPKENKVQQYESLIEKTTDKNQVAQLLDAIKNDKDLTKAQKAEVATKFFEKNDAQYPGVLDAGKRQKAEIGLDKAKTLEDIKQVDREALPAKKQKVFDKKKAEFEKKNSQKVKSVIKDINKIKEPAKLDAKIEELSNEKFFDKVSEAQANEVRSAIRKRQAEIETSGIKEANENVAVKKKQNVFTRAKNWWNSQKVKSVIRDINKIKEPAKLDAKIEELSNEKFFDKVSEAQANEVRSAIRKRQAEIETSGIKEANENSIGKKQKLDEHKSQNIENSFAKFEDMIAKSDDLSKVQAKLSNNPEFNKLSNADKLKLLEKLNKRKAELEAAAKTEDNVSLTQKETTRTKKYTTPQNESAFEKATRNCNNPNEVAPPRTVRLGKEKFNEAKQNLIDALDDITTIDDPQIGILEKRINSLQIRSQRRTLQELLDKKKADLTNAKLQSDVSSQTKTPNTENSFAKFEDIIAKSDDMSQVRAKLSNNPEFNKLSQAEQRQLIAKINQREIEIVDMKNTFVKFEDMIAKADDLSQVQAKLSNNPEFNKLSNADKLKLLEKLNKRKAELEAAASKSIPKETPESAQKETPKDDSNASKKTGYSDNLFNNVKDMKTPTLGGLNAVKSVDEKLVKPLEDALNSTLDPNQQYIYAQPPVNEDSIEEENSEVDSEDEVTEEPPVQEGGDAEDVNAPEDNEKAQNPDETNENPDNNDEIENPTPENQEQPSNDAPATPQTPVTDTTQSPSSPTSPSSSVRKTDGTPQIIGQGNADKAKSVTNDNAGRVDKPITENATEEPDIPPVKKAEITKRVQDAKTDEEISVALRELREVGRFKGRKNLRRLLKAKRKYNKELAENDMKKADKYQDRVEKYQEKVNANIDKINEAYRKKKFDA